MALEVPTDNGFDADAAVESYLSPKEPTRAPGSMRGSMAAAVDANPDTQAELRKVAERTGVPVTSLNDEANRAQVVKQHNFDTFDFTGYEEKFPASAGLLSDTEFAQVAHDDVENMGLIEATVKELGNAGRFLASGLPKANQGLYGSLETVAAVGSKYIGQPADRLLQGLGGQGTIDVFGAAQGFFNKMRSREKAVEVGLTAPALEGAGPIKRDIYSGFQSVGTTLPATVMSILTGNPAPALASAGVTTGGLSAGEALDQGIDPLVALGYGLSDASVEVGTELIPITKFIGDLKAGSGVLKTITHQLASEVPGELMATTLQNFNEWAVLNPDQPFQTYLDALPGDLKSTLVATVTAVGAQTSAITLANKATQRIQARERQAQQAETGAQTVEQLTKLAASSKLLARDPESFERFIEAANAEADVTDIYLDPKELAQSGVDLAKLAAISPSVEKQIQLASETGGLLKIPVSEYATNVAASELGQSLLDHAKTDPLGMSRAEAKEFMQSAKEEFETEVQKGMEENQVTQEFVKSQNVVLENVLTQLETTNRFTEDVNRQYASLLSNFYTVQAQRLGVTPEEMFARYPVQIQAESVAGPSFSQDPDDELEALQGKWVEPQYGGTETSIYTSDEGIHLGKIIVDDDKQGQGYGTKVMQELIAYADKHGQRIVLTPGTDFGGSSKKRLVAFYKRFGFVENKGRNKDFSTRETMIRPPKDQELTQADMDAAHDIESADTFEQTQRGSFNPETSTITLLKAADLSTFLHESGHFFLETLNKMALDPNAPPEILVDMQATLEWLGVDGLAEWNTRSLEEQREGHEKFARGFEAYLFEGKSPNVELAGIFGRFRDWLLMVYKNIKGLNVELSPDIRGVFDRLLATSEAIAEAESLTGFKSMFATAEDIGMSPDEWAQYQKLGAEATEQARADLGSKTLKDIKWLSNARSKKLRELQKDAEAKRRTIRREVTAEVMGEPVNQARQFIRRGETINGEKTEGAHRIDADALREMYDDSNPDVPALWRELETKYGAYGMIGKDGLHPDALAEQFGFSSGDELIKALISAEDPRAKIAGMTDQRMLERYGDITDPKSLERAADAAIHNEARAKFVATEVNALNRATGKRKILIDAAKQYANLMIGRLRVRDVKPSRYTAAEAKAARAAEKAMRAGDLETAAIEKRSQLVQLHAAKAALEAQDDIEKAVRYFNKFQKEGVREKLSNDYLEQIDALLERFDLRKGQSLKQIDKRASLLAWVEAQKEVGIEPEIPVEILDAAYRKHYKDMTVEEMRGLVDTIKQIEHLGRLKEKLLTAANNRDFNNTIIDLTTSIEMNGGNRQADNTTRATLGDRAVKLFKGYIASHRKISSLARQMDGVKDGGAMWETFIRSMNVAGDNEASMREKATEKMLELAAPLMKSGKMGGKGVFFPTLGRSLNREERIALALNSGNAGNMQRLLDGEGWSRDGIQPVLDTITPEEAKFVQDVWKLFESFRPQIAAKEKRIYGKEPDWVEPVPIVLGGVELEGGYFPIKYDHRRSLAAEQHNDAETAKQQMKGAYTSATTRRSFVKSRADEVRGRPLLLTMNGLYGGLNEVIHDLAWHEWLIDANRLMRSKRLDGTIRSIYGAETVQQFKKAIEDIAAGEMRSDGDFEKVLGNLRSGASVAGLGLNVVSAIVNTTGITQSFVRIGPRWVMQGVNEWASNPRGMIKEIYGKSEFMRLRGKTMNRELNEIQSMLQDKTKVRAALDRYSYLPMTMTQIAVDAPTWYGAYQKALAEDNEETRAVALADQAVVDAQGGGQVKDLAAIQRGSNFKKLFTTFYGYFSTTLQLTAEVTAKTNFKDPRDIMRLGGDYLMLYTVPALLGTILKGILMGDADDWWDDPAALAKQMANDQVGYIMSPLVGVRELSGGVQKALGVNLYNSAYGGPAGLRFLSEYDKLATQIGQGDLDRAMLRSLVNVAGVTLRLPSSQINRTIDGAAAIMEGNTVNPLALITGAPRE